MKNISTAAMLAVLASFTTGCVSTPPTLAPNAEGETFVDAIAMTCNAPYQLTRDCNPVRGPGAKLEIAGIEMKIAGSEDGKLIVLSAGSALDRRGEGANEAYRLVETVLSEHQVQVTRLVPLVSANILKGYAITTDIPAYGKFEPYRQ